MPFPPLNKHGVLPAGVYPCTLEEASVFGAKSLSAKRADLWKKLASFLRWIKPWGVFTVYYVDGSFVTDKKEPDDIDVVLEMPIPKPGVLHSFDLKLFDEDYIYNKYRIHLHFWWHGVKKQNDFRSFFQYVRVAEARRRGLKPGETKGILKLVL